MKTVTFAILAGIALGVAGCVSNVTDPKPGSMSGYRDRVERRFDRPLNAVFEASKRALIVYGNITAESAFSTATNQVRTLSGTVNQSKVWMRIEGVAPSVTLVTVQMRAAVGGSDLTMANEMQNRIALELTP
jgi:hypothetical protein